MADRRLHSLRRVAFALLVGLAALTGPLPAEAHSLKVFAVVEGQTIRGTVYFSGAAPARGARITVRGPDGGVLAETVSGDDGSFIVPAGPQVDHRIAADAGDGHSAVFVVRALEIPANAAGAAAPPVVIAPGLGGMPGPAAEAASQGLDAVHPANAAALETALDAVVSRHVTPLRDQLNAYEDRLRWHDVLGGIGYIFGLTGLAALLLSRRRRGDPQR